MNRLLLERLIKNILKEDGSASPYVNLNIKSFQDRDVRVQTLISKLEAGEPLTLQKGLEPIIIKEVIVITKEEVVSTDDEESDVKDTTQTMSFEKGSFAELASVLPLLKPYDKLIFVGENNVKYPVTAIAKTPDLGGWGKGSTLKHERLTIDSLNNQIKDLGGEICIEFNGETYSNIIGVKNISGQPKADFAFIDKSGPVLFISHKAGSTPKDFHHYGGISKLNAETITNFVDAVKKKSPELFKRGTEYGIPLDPVKDSDIILKAMYGNDYGAPNYGINNVQVILQGDIQLAKSEDSDCYSLTANKTLTPPEIPTDEDYAPYLAASYAQDRDQGGIKHCRLRILPASARGKNKLVNPIDEPTQDDKVS